VRTLSLIILVALIACVAFGPSGPAHYDVYEHGKYYRYEEWQGSEREYAQVLVEVPTEDVNRPEIESPFWRHMDKYGWLTLWVYIGVFAIYYWFGDLFRYIKRRRSNINREP